MSTPTPTSTPRKDHVYRLSKLNWLFAVSAVLLLLSVAAMVADDYRREWKGYQRDFNRAEATRLKEEIQAAAAGIDSSKVAALRGEHKAATQALAKHDDALKAARSTYTAAQGRWYRSDQDYRFTKAIYDAERYDFEEAVHKGARESEEVGRRNEARRQRMVGHARFDAGGRDRAGSGEGGAAASSPPGATRRSPGSPSSTRR